MEHVSEVAKILDGAVRHDPAQAINYANLLVTKLEAAGEAHQARVIRKVLNKSSARAIHSASAATPADKDTNLSTVTIEWPDGANRRPVVLSRSANEAVAGFVSTIRERDRLAKHGIDIPARLLLHGPPGTGKTSLAREIAASLELPLVTTRSDALVSSFLGQTARNIRDVFDYASRQPCVLFLDEFDALAKNRADAREVGELQRVVIALLENLDAFDTGSVLIAATNHPQLLDPAVWRRFATTVETVLPGSGERRTMWAHTISMLPIDDTTLDVLTEHSDGMSGAAIRTAGLEIARGEVLALAPEVRLPHALLRLARLRDWGNPEDTLGDEIRLLRRVAPTVFTHRSLGDVFHISTRQVAKHLRGDDARVETGTIDAVLEK